MAAIMPILGTPEPPAAGEPELHPLAAEACGRLARWWPHFGAMRRM